MATPKSKDTIATLLMILLLGGIGWLVSALANPIISSVPIFVIGLATVALAIGLAWLYRPLWGATGPEHTGAKGTMWLVFQVVGGFILVLGALGVIVADILAGFGWVPLSIVWGLLLIAGNVAFLVGAWYALYYRPRAGLGERGKVPSR